jgi:hypothetical protein
VAKSKRERRIEKRRRRRERQRQGDRERPGWSIQLSGKALGLPRMSETLVEFAEPLLSELPKGAGAAEWAEALHIATVVWNGLVVCYPQEKLVADLKQGLGRDVDVEGLVEELARRKATRFSDDLRFVFDVRTHEAGDRVHVTALSALAQ